MDYVILRLNPDVDVEEMKQSNSKSKYVHVYCERITIPLTNNKRWLALSNDCGASIKAFDKEGEIRRKSI